MDKRIIILGGGRNMNDNWVLVDGKNYPKEKRDSPNYF